VKIILPFGVKIPRKTKEDKIFALNLNIYRNAHHMILNQAKILWKNIVLEAVQQVSVCDIKYNIPYHFTYTAYPCSHRKFDLGNILPIVQKFTDDALIDIGLLTDDNYKIISYISYRFGGVDKENPRIELEIRSING
jgi:Holliday junction resolvase RusA-like endonuclease